MKISDLISMCLRNLLRRKFRTFLTVMGVVIGTCAIIVMISLGVGMSVSQEEWLNSIGDLTVIEVYSQGSSQDVLLNDEAVALMQAIPGVDIATPMMTYYPDQGSSQLFAGKKERYGSWSQIIGVYPEALAKLGYVVETGETLPEKAGSKKIPMVFGSMAVYDFYNTKNYNSVDSWPDVNGNIADPYFQPMDMDYHFKLTSWNGDSEKKLNYDAETVGILADGGENNYETKYNIFIHIDDMKRMKAEFEKAMGIKKDKNAKEQYNTVKVKVLDIKNVSDIQKQIEEMGFGVWSMEAIRESMQERAQQTQLILGILGGVSLFVAAISITNTMIMSVYERTREIGVMKVLGCLVSNIRSVFLMEAGLIGFIGGIIGVGISYLLSFLLNTFGGVLGNFLGGMGGSSKVSIIPPWLVLLGLAFATLIGLCSGFQPANRAVKISALEAIKTE